MARVEGGLPQAPAITGVRFSGAAKVDRGGKSVDCSETGEFDCWIVFWRGETPGCGDPPSGRGGEIGDILREFETDWSW